MKPNPVVHFEMPYEDKNRAAEFYKTAFGWQPKMMGAEMGDYVVMQTAETDEKGMLKEPGRINGGMFKKSPTNDFTSFVIAVDDIREAMKRVTEAGGKIMEGESAGEPTDIPGIGLYIGFTDTEGNRVSMLEPKGM